MDPAYQDKKIVDLSDAELIALGFLGEDVAPEVKDIVDQVKTHPNHLGTVTCLMVNCLKRTYADQSSPQNTTQQIIESLYSGLINSPDAHTVIAPNLIPYYEMNFWYHGISPNPPKLMWRSDHDTNPFPVPPPGTDFSKIPAKTAHGVFNTPLNKVWDDVAPQILASMKARGLKYSALMTTRFSTAVEDSEDETLGPVVVWIAVHPNTTDARAVRDATPDILHILADVQITDIVVEWYEGSIVRL